jgi:hypothetical protein
MQLDKSLHSKLLLCVVESSLSPCIISKQMNVHENNLQHLVLAIIFFLLAFRNLTSKSNFKMQIQHNSLINPTGACRAANSAEIWKAEKHKKPGCSCFKTLIQRDS